jgi:uncharacterized protein (TIGR02466 family)
VLKEVIKLFPTTVARYQYRDHVKFKHDLMNIIDSAPKSNTRISDTNNSKHYYEESTGFLELDEVKDFKKFLIESANTYINDLMKFDTNMVITDCWINKTDAGYKEPMHNHANSFISATYYVNFDKACHGPLEVQQNKHKYNSLPYFLLLPSEFNDLNTMGFTFNDIQEGELIIWPSNLEHGFYKNDCDNRISIAINFLPEYVTNGPYKFKIGKT